MTINHPVKKTKWLEYVQWKGVLSEARERLNAAKSDSYRKNMAELMTEGVCTICKGSRIKPYPSACAFHGKTIAELTNFSLEDLLKFFRDRKSTRLNSSHVKISYAVFCLKKKKTQNKNKIMRSERQRTHARAVQPPRPADEHQGHRQWRAASET